MVGEATFYSKPPPAPLPVKTTLEKFQDAIIGSSVGGFVSIVSAALGLAKLIEKRRRRKNNVAHAGDDNGDSEDNDDEATRKKVPKSGKSKTAEGGADSASPTSKSTSGLNPGSKQRSRDVKVHPTEEKKAEAELLKKAAPKAAASVAPAAALASSGASAGSSSSSSEASSASERDTQIPESSWGPVSGDLLDKVIWEPPELLATSPSLPAGQPPKSQGRSPGG